MKLSSLVHQIKGDNGSLLFHSTNFFQIYLKGGIIDSILSFLKEHNSTKKDLIYLLESKNVNNAMELLQVLENKKFLVYSDKDDLESISEAKNEFRDLPYITLLYVVLGTGCNLSCDYCFVGPDEEKNVQSTFKVDNNLKLLESALSQLPSSSKKITILYYGGEPLLYFDELKSLTKFFNSQIEGKSIEYVLITNGTLINKKVASWLHDNNFSVGVSIDGSKYVHDMHRKTRSGKGSYDHALQGFINLKEAGCDPSISLTVSDSNIDNLIHELQYIIKNFKPNSLGFNPLLVPADGENYAGAEYAEKFAENAYIGWKLLRDKNIFEDRCMRIIRNLTERKIRYNDCGACGNQIVLLPNSRMSICQGLLSNEEHTYELHEWDGKFNKALLEWSKRSPLNMKECYDCIALGVCGGGCPCRLIAKGNSMWEIDTQHCVFSKHVVQSFLKEICLEKEKKLIIS